MEFDDSDIEPCFRDAFDAAQVLPDHLLIRLLKRRFDVCFFGRTRTAEADVSQGCTEKSTELSFASRFIREGTRLEYLTQMVRYLDALLGIAEAERQQEEAKHYGDWQADADDLG